MFFKLDFCTPFFFVEGLVNCVVNLVSLLFVSPSSAEAFFEREREGLVVLCYIFPWVSWRIV